MTLRQLELTTALRPLLLPEEILLFVQDSVGLYRDKYKIEGHQNGHAYLTSHRICYIDNDEPRQRSVAIDLKDIDYPELYAGFLKSSPKITLFPRVNKTRNLAIRPPPQSYSFASASSSPTRSGFASASPSPAPQPRDASATWICPICSFSNPVPVTFDPATANANTPLPPCQACGIKPPLVHLTKAAIAAMSNRSASVPLNDNSTSRPVGVPDGGRSKYIECPRCTFRNHPSIATCEICGVSLASIRNSQLASVASPPSRSESPAPFIPATSTYSDPSMDVIKLSFRNGGVQIFFDRLKDALIQRKWLLQSAPPPPRPQSWSSSPGNITQAPQPRKGIGIAALERRDIELRKTNELVIGSSFSDLEALMTSAKEVIAMAERFASSSNSSEEANSLLSDMGLTTTRDMLSSSSATTYLTQLSRDLAELLTDDKTGLLRREGGIMTLVDLWAVFNRRRNGIELVSPKDFDAATRLWEDLRLPLRRREFRSGVAVVQGRDRTDEKTVAAILAWLAELRANVGGWGQGVTALDAAARFGWSLGVAGEELGMAEDRGAVVRDADASGVSFWENQLMLIEGQE